MYKKKSHIHFVGIGGIGMSGIAHILRTQGYTISGCDLDTDQHSIRNLLSAGCQIHEGNNTPACHDESIDILVYSSAIRAHNPEIIAAQQRGVATIPRALMLAELMRTKYSIAIAGSHGKTTTTSLISHILIEAQLDPTIIIGGHLKSIGTNARHGLGDYLVAEADESDRSLVKLQATFGLITNIDLEHLETYRDLDDIKETFKRFLDNIPFYGSAILCIDDENVRALLPMPHLGIIKYGLDDSADVYGQQLTLHPSHSTVTIFAKHKKLGDATINMPGRHNALNALGATALALELGIPFDTIASALASFNGVDRRFTYKGTLHGAEVFDDYGHHPQEIYNTLLVARKRAHKKLTVVFQPHRYSRTDKLWQQFVEIFLQGDIDHLIITDIYPASEAPIPGVTGENLALAIAARNPSFSISYVPFDPLLDQLKLAVDPLITDQDLLLLLGAGKVNKLAYYCQ